MPAVTCQYRIDPAAWVDSLMCGFAPPDCDNHWIAVLTPFELKGFADDSGSDARGPVYVLAGFVSRARDWKKCSRKFKSVLNKPPKLPFFKSCGEEGVTTLLEPAQREKKITELVNVLTSTMMLRVECVLRWGDYESVVRGKIREDIDDPYFILFYKVILTVARHEIQYGWNEKVDWTFDEQGPVSNKAVVWYYQFLLPLTKTRPPFNNVLGALPLLRDDKKTIGLQAADLYAWQVRRRLGDEDRLYGHEMRSALKSLRGGIQGIERHLKRSDLEDFVREINSGMYPHIEMP